MRGYESQQSHRADDDHLSRFEAEMDRLKTDREKAVQHAEDLGYQVEVLRAKLHEARRNLATRPAHDSADIGYQAEQMLRNAQIQAEQMRTDAERELREARAQTQRILQEHAEHQARLQAELHAEAVQRRQRLDQELAERRQTVESHVNENVAWAEQLRSRTEAQAHAAAGRVAHGGRAVPGRRPRRDGPARRRDPPTPQLRGRIGPCGGRGHTAAGPQGRRTAARSRLHPGPGGHQPRGAAALRGHGRDRADAAADHRAEPHRRTAHPGGRDPPARGPAGGREDPGRGQGGARSSGW